MGIFKNLLERIKSKKQDRTESKTFELYLREKEEESKRKERLILYGICSREYMLTNLYPIGGNGIMPNARYIANQHGAELEFRHSNYWEGLHSHGHCFSVFVVGECPESLEKARDEIYEWFGVRRAEASLDVDGLTIFN